MSVTLLNVLNTVTALGTDAYVDSSGYLNIQGTPAFKASSIDSVVITPYVAEVAQVSTVTVSTVSNSAIYTMSLICNDVNSGMITSVPLTVTSDSTASNTEIAAAFAAAINSMPELSVSATSSTTLVVTAKAGFPIFTLTTTDSKLSISTSAGTVGVGTGTSLIAKYPSTAGYYNAGGFSAASSIVASNTYTEVTVSSVVGNSAVILVKTGATNYSDLLGTYGTLTGLKAGYKVTMAAAAANASVTNGVITIVTDVFYGNTDTNIGLQAGDVVAIGGVSYPIASILTGATAASYGTPNDASSATTVYAKWRNLPL
jgi:hypothetical protein